MLKIGIIGLGGIADTAHAPAINDVDGAQLVAVLSRDAEKGRAFLSKHNPPDGTVITSLEDFVSNSDTDLVIICSPDGLHYEQTKACLEAGKHVLAEKPMTTSTDQAKELVELASAKGLLLKTGFHLRSHNGHKLLKQKIDAGEIGNVRHIRAIWAFPMPDDSNWRAKDDTTRWWSLSAVGSHCIDLTRWLANDTDDWKKFQAVTTNQVWGGPHDETAVISAQFASGPTAEITSSVLFGPYNRIEIFGDKGTAVCSGTLGRDGTGRITINEKEMTYDPVIPFVNQLQEIKDSIESGIMNQIDSSVGLRSVLDLELAIK